MHINWFTVVAQLVNFMILVWLMKRYLYKPILQAIDVREKKIAAELADAKNKKMEARSEQDEFKKKNEVFDEQKKKKMDDITTDCENDRQKLIGVAKTEAANEKSKLIEDSKNLVKSLNNQLMQEIQNRVLSITKKVLSEIASTNLEEQTIHVFIRNIKAITDEDKRQFAEAFHSDSNPILIASAFDLSDKEKTSIKSALVNLLGTDVKCAFETNPKMIGGIEISTTGYKLSWSLEAYMNSLEKSLTLSA